MLLFGVSFCAVVTYVSSYLAEWPPFGKELLIRLTVCSPCIVSIRNFGHFGETFGLIAGMFLSLFTFLLNKLQFLGNS